MARKIFVYSLWLTIVVAGCGAVPSEEPSSLLDRQRTQSELRPTSPEDSRSYGDAPVSSFASPGGHARVWWAEEGTDAPELTDANASGVPDYVELVASVADDVAHFLTERGWKLPIKDSELLNDPEDFGGDGRFDIYLKNFGAGDGHFRVDACVNSFGTIQCAGHILLESKFSPFYYPSTEYAVKVVVSHEFFHGVQNAYRAEMPNWWSEGSATWFQEYFFPEQNDFENLTRYFFETPERSLHDRMRGPSDAFAYGTSIFVYFLEQHLGAQGVRKIHELMAAGNEALEAVSSVVETSTGGGLIEGFQLFSIWNVFTGSRAVQQHGYPHANRFNEVPITSLNANESFNWDVQVKPLAAKFGVIEFERAISIEVEAHEGFELAQVAAANATEFEHDGHFYLPGNEQTRLNFEAEKSPLYFVISNGALAGDAAVRIKVRQGTQDFLSGEETVETIADSPANEYPSDETSEVVMLPEDPAHTGCHTGCHTLISYSHQPQIPQLFMFLFAVVLYWRVPGSRNLTVSKC